MHYSTGWLLCGLEPEVLNSLGNIFSKALNQMQIWYWQFHWLHWDHYYGQGRVNHPLLFQLSMRVLLLWQLCHLSPAICGEDWLGIFPRWLCLSSQHHCWWPLWRGVFLVLAKDPLYNTHLNWFGSSQHHMAFVMWCFFSACQRPSWHPS